MSNEDDNEPDVYSIPENVNKHLVQLVNLVTKIGEYIPLSLEYHNHLWYVSGNKVYCLDEIGYGIWIGEFGNRFDTGEYTVLYPVRYGDSILTVILDACDECDSNWEVLNG